MKNLNTIISTARKTAQEWNQERAKDPKAWHPPVSLGATEGQVLWTNTTGALEMISCWLEIKLTNHHDTNEYKVAFSPLLPVNKNKPIQFRENVYLDEVILNDLTEARHDFGGKTIEFYSNAHTKFDLNQNIWNQLQYYANEQTPAFDHYIYENSGELILIGPDNTVFSLGEAADSDTDGGCYVRYYDELAFIELSDEEDERDALLANATDTGDNAIIVPTIWLKENRERQCFLDFVANWRQSVSDKYITGKVGKFSVTHEVYRNKLVTQISLPLSDSAQ